MSNAVNDRYISNDTYTVYFVGNIFFHSKGIVPDTEPRHLSHDFPSEAPLTARRSVKHSLTSIKRTSKKSEGAAAKIARPNLFLSDRSDPGTPSQ